MATLPSATWLSVSISSPKKRRGGDNCSHFFLECLKKTKTFSQEKPNFLCPPLPHPKMPHKLFIGSSWWPDLDFGGGAGILLEFFLLMRTFVEIFSSAIFCARFNFALFFLERRSSSLFCCVNVSVGSIFALRVEKIGRLGSWQKKS